MRHHERAVGESMPTHEQLRKLAAIGMSSAVQRDKLRHLKPRPAAGRISEPSHYVLDELELVGSSIFQPEEPTQVRHLMAMRVGTRREDDAPKVWSLKFFDAYWAEYAPGQWLGERTLYRFEWNRSAVLMADRTFRLVGIERPENELEYYLDHLTITDDMPDILHAEQQMSHITSEDCEHVLDSAQGYFSAVESVHQFTKR